MLKPKLKYEDAHLCNHQVPYTNQLFGDDVSKAAKEIEANIGIKMQQYGPYRGFGGNNRRGRAGFCGCFRNCSQGIARGQWYSSGSSWH